MKTKTIPKPERVARKQGKKLNNKIPITCFNKNRPILIKTVTSSPLFEEHVFLSLRSILPPPQSPGVSTATLTSSEG